MNDIVGDMAEQDPERGTPIWWNARYLNGDTPWDTGIVPPEVREVVEGGLLTLGWALDLGCGSGLNSRYLARHEFRVIGLDLALSPLARGAVAARQASLPSCFAMADVTRPPLASLNATFALDIGCFHAVPPERRGDYAAALARLLTRGAYYLLYAFEPWISEERGPVGIGPEIFALLAPHFSLCWARHGHDGDRPSAWYLFRRI